MQTIEKWLTPFSSLARDKENFKIVFHTIWFHHFHLCSIEIPSPYSLLPTSWKIFQEVNKSLCPSFLQPGVKSESHFRNRRRQLLTQPPVCTVVALHCCWWCKECAYSARDWCRPEWGISQEFVLTSPTWSPDSSIVILYFCLRPNIQNIELFLFTKKLTANSTFSWPPVYLSFLTWFISITQRLGKLSGWMKNEWKAKTSESVPHCRLKIAEGLHYRLTIQCKPTKSILSTHGDPSPKRWITSQYYEAHLKAKCEKYQKMTVSKHCQRRNGPEGWVLLTEVTSLGHITISYTNLDQILSSESRPSINSNIFAKYQHLNLNFKILTKPTLIISTKIQLHKLN